MKKYLFITCILVSSMAFCQEKLGYSKTELLNSFSDKPCKTNSEAIWYCSPDGGRTCYQLKNNYVSGEVWMFFYETKHEAENSVRKLVAGQIKAFGPPTRIGDMFFWYTESHMIKVYYTYFEGQHFADWSISER